VPQAGSSVSSDAGNDASEDGGRSRSWWVTLPGMLTAAAGLISAITGLVVAVQQLRPTSHTPSPAAQAQAIGTNISAANTAASKHHTGAAATGSAGIAGAARVTFTAGRHAELGDNRYDVLAATARPGNPGELALALRVRMTNGGRYPGNFWGSSFRLRVGANTNPPSNFLDDVVAAGTTDTGEIDFTIPASARRATLLVGDDPDNAVALPLAFSGGS
jgi:hypothetical protein